MGCVKGYGTQTYEHPDPRRSIGAGGSGPPPRTPVRVAAALRGLAAGARAGDACPRATGPRPDQSAAPAHGVGARAAPPETGHRCARRRADRPRQRERPRSADGRGVYRAAEERGGDGTPAGAGAESAWLPERRLTPAGDHRGIETAPRGA